MFTKQKDFAVSAAAGADVKCYDTDHCVCIRFKQNRRYLDIPPALAGVSSELRHNDTE